MFYYFGMINIKKNNFSISNDRLRARRTAQQQLARHTAHRERSRVITAHRCSHLNKTHTSTHPQHKRGTMASAIFITDLQGKSIISRNYRGDIPVAKAVEIFSKYLSDVEEETRKPIFHVDVNGDFESGDGVGMTGPGGQTFVYVAVSTQSTMEMGK